MQFINLLTNDDNIRIGHDLESQTFEINTSRYIQDGVSVTLVDTPGFNDSREGFTDTDIIGKIVDFLQEGWALFILR
jgi:predicted GTPase